MHPLKHTFLWLRFVPLCLLLAVCPATASEFLWLSDIHFDPLADRTLVDKLAAAEPTQWAEIFAGGSLKFPPYGRDTNWALLSSVLQAATKAQPRAAFTIVTGDLLVHHFREQFNAAATVHDEEAFRAFVRKTVEFVGLQLKERSPRAPVFLTVGNNDDECADYAIQPDGPFLHDTAKVVGDLAGVAEMDSYARYGSYRVPNPEMKHAQIIVLNTVFFSPRYVNRCGSPGEDDPGDKVLAWLANELAAAQAKHEKVWLVYHIPPGVDAFATTHAKVPGAVTLLWKDSYTNRFLSLLEQYPGVVGANFAGHIHVDDFRLFGRSLAIIAPAVSPITGQNPTFRSVEFDSHGNLKDQQTYYLANLTEANQETPAAWPLEYDFDKQWGLKGLNAGSYSQLFARVSDSPDTAARWAVLYSTSHAASSMTPNQFRALYCAEKGTTAHAYQSCVAPKESTHGKTTN